MKYALPHGGSVQLAVQPMTDAIRSGLKHAMTILDAKFAVLDVSIPQITRGEGVAAALASLATGVGSKSHATRIKNDIAAIEEGIASEVRLAKSLTDQADDFNLLLRSCANHILHGFPISNAELDSSLAEAAMTLRRSYQLGDPGGVAKETVDLLMKNADQAAADIATAKDFVVRKLTSVIRIASMNHRAEKLQSAAISANFKLALIDKGDRNALDSAAALSRKRFDVLKKAYGDSYLDGLIERRIPCVRSIDKSRLVRGTKKWTAKS